MQFNFLYFKYLIIEFIYIRKAAKLGFSKALNKLGDVYFSGITLLNI